VAEFIRVRDLSTKHEYDAPVSEVDTNPGLYEVIDKEPVDAPRPATYHVPAKKDK
jgi:hypothetical protein